MVKKAKIEYDTENDILWVYMGDKVRDSFEVDPYVIDFSSNNKVVGIEIMNASKILSLLTLNKITKAALSRTQQAEMHFWQGKDIMYIVIKLILVIKNETCEIPVQIPAPMSVVGRH